MNSNYERIATTLAVTVIAVFFASCAATGPLQSSRQTIELGDAASAHIAIKMGGGELTVSGGAPALMEATFTYNIADWEPEVDYSVQNGRGVLAVRQPVSPQPPIMGNVQYRWDLRLNPETPIDLDIELGAGKSDLDLREISLAGLNVVTGAADTRIDLSGKQSRDLDVAIEGGVGNLNLLLPKSVGVRVTVEGLVGEIEAPSLRQEGNTYINDLLGTTAATMRVHIKAGIGQVQLQ